MMLGVESRIGHQMNITGSSSLLVEISGLLSFLGQLKMKVISKFKESYTHLHSSFLAAHNKAKFTGNLETMA